MYQRLGVLEKGPINLNTTFIKKKNLDLLFTPTQFQNWKQ